MSRISSGPVSAFSTRSRTPDHAAIEERPRSKDRETREDDRQHAIVVRIREKHLRRDAALQLRQRVAVRAGADLDPVPAHPRRAGSPRCRAGRGAGCGILSGAAQPLPLAGLGRAVVGQTRPCADHRRQTAGLEAAGTVRRRRWQIVRVHQQGPAAAPARARRGYAHRAAQSGGQPQATHHRPHHDRGGTGAGGRRSQPARHPRPRPRNQHRPHRRPALLHPVAGV